MSKALTFEAPSKIEPRTGARLPFHPRLEPPIVSLMHPNWLQRLFNRFWKSKRPVPQSPAQMVSDPRRKADHAPKLFPPSKADPNFDPEATLIMNQGGRKR